MGIPLVALSAAPPPSPVEQLGKVLSLRNIMQQGQTQQLQQQALSQENQQRQLALQDQMTLRSIAPNHVTKDDKGNVTGFDTEGFLNEAAGKQVNPATLNAMRIQYATATKDLASASETVRNNEMAKNKAAYELLEGVRSEPDVAKRGSILQAGLPNLQKLGFDTSKLAQQPQLDDKSLLDTEATLGVHQQMIADAKTQAETQKQFADAALANIKINLAQNSKPGDFDKQIDQIADPKGANAVLNQQTKVLVNGALGKGDYESAQKAVEHLGNTLDEMRKTEYVQNREDFRAALGRQATQSNQLQKNGLEQLDKIWTDPQHGYTQFLAQANATKNAIHSAQDGNELAASLAPLMTVLGVNSFAGVHRINPQEYQAAGPQVGSVYRRINTVLDKAVEGKLNPDTAKEMDGLVDELMSAKHASLIPASQLISKNAGLDPSKTTVFTKEGKTDTLDNVSKPQVAAPQVAEVKPTHRYNPQTGQIEEIKQ